MDRIHVDAVTVPEDRQRTKFTEDSVAELKASIEKRGLMHPLVLRSDERTLISGERRLRAMRELHGEGKKILFGGVRLGAGEAPYTSQQEADALELEEMELEENIMREDLTFQERAAVEARLHNLRTAQKEQRGEKQTLDDTVQELISEGSNSKSASARLSRSLVIAEHLDDPEVQSAKTEKDAMKHIERKARTEDRRQRAAEWQERKIDSPHTVFHGDARELLHTLPDRDFQCILTDPPYGMGADGFGDMSDSAHQYDDSAGAFEELMGAVLPELSRIAADESHLYLFCDIGWFPYLRQAVEAEGFKAFRTPLVWCSDSGLTPWPESGPRRRTEYILYAVKGSRRVNRIASDWLQYPRVRGQQYGAEKPVDLYEDLLSRSVLPGDRVIDPFAGTGPILPAANRCECAATAIEFYEEKYTYALTRQEEN